MKTTPLNAHFVFFLIHPLFTARVAPSSVYSTYRAVSFPPPKTSRIIADFVVRLPKGWNNPDYIDYPTPTLSTGPFSLCLSPSQMIFGYVVSPLQ